MRPALSELERYVLDREAELYRFQGAKAERVLAEVGLSPTRYAQILNRLIDDPASLEVDPVTVNRLRRLREARLASRRGIFRPSV